MLRVQAPASARPGDKAVGTAQGIAAGWIGGGCAQPAVLRTVRQALADGRARLIRIAPSDNTAEQGERPQAALPPPSGLQARWPSPASRPLPGPCARAQPPEGVEQSGQATFAQELDDVLEFGMACHSGGTLELFVDPVPPRSRLVVIGDSPVAVALAGLAPRVGLQVTLVARGADAARFADAGHVLASDEPAALAQVIAPGSLVVVATQGRRDVQGLRAALALQAHTVWLVASARKAQVLKDALVTAGHEAAAVAAIVAPAGIPMAEQMGAHTPEEVALSVLAAVVAARRRGRPVGGQRPAQHPPLAACPRPCRCPQSRRRHPAAAARAEPWAASSRAAAASTAG